MGVVGQNSYQWKPNSYSKYSAFDQSIFGFLLWITFKSSIYIPSHKYIVVHYFLAIIF